MKRQYFVTTVDPSGLSLRVYACGEHTEDGWLTYVADNLTGFPYLWVAFTGNDVMMSHRAEYRPTGAVAGAALANKIAVTDLSSYDVAGKKGDN